jgi:ABC-type xylose transport system permease subunit
MEETTSMSGTTDAAQVASKGSIWAMLRGVNYKDVIPFMSLIVVLGIFVILIPDRFPTWANARLLLLQSAITMTVGFGMTFVIVAGSIDLSVGSVVALAAVVGGSVIAGGSVSLGILASVATGLVCDQSTARCSPFSAFRRSSSRSACCRPPED